MKKFMQKKHFIGVDISKNVLDLALLKETGKNSFVELHTENTIKGFSRIVSWIEKQGLQVKDCAFCMEHTGTYGLLFYAWLAQKGLLFSVQSGLQIKQSLGMIRGKNDVVDARRIADYAFTHKVKLRPFIMPSAVLIKIKQLLTYREQIVRIRTALKNSLKSHKQYQSISGLCNITDQIYQQIDRQDQIIAGIKQQIMDVIESDELLHKNYDLITSVKGVGLIIGAFMIVSTNNFTSFENGRKYACYAGIAPFEFSSGTSIRGRTRTSKYGNTTIKTLLNNGANSAIRYDNQMKQFYQRKREQGKDHKVIVNAVCCKLVNRIFAVIKRGTPYVTVYEQNFPN
ncbi:IS110 family transposase [Sinomicrobium kalidii]|uniref:IS110 family transposase n=1 Tax=Sinomicrobium kalidii TaxID=2900738 RepID=UPI001E47790E|nr:IS110 family transposase [Sinomicrobium kalidii]UGU14437.1 IS110 family transposase [Sinomicrobium kalidii]